MKSEAVVTPGAGGAATAPTPSVDPIFAPPREKPSGFGAVEDVIDAEEVTPLTTIDAEVVEGAGSGQPVQSSTKPKKKKNRGKKRKKN